DVDRAHLLPGFRIHREGMIGLASRRRSAVNEVSYLPHCTPRIGQQRVPGAAMGEISDPWHRELGAGRCRDRRGYSIPTHVREYSSHAFTDQSLRDGATDTVSRTCHQGGLARRVEWVAEEAHICRSLSSSVEQRNIRSAPQPTPPVASHPWPPLSFQHA